MWSMLLAVVFFGIKLVVTAFCAGLALNTTSNAIRGVVLVALVWLWIGWTGFASLALLTVKIAVTAVGLLFIAGQKRMYVGRALASAFLIWLWFGGSPASSGENTLEAAKDTQEAIQNGHFGMWFVDQFR